MTKSKPTVASLTTEIAELKSTVAVLATAVTQITELLTNPVETAPATNKTAKSKSKTKKSNGNKWFCDYRKGKGLELMKNNSGTGKEKSAIWNELKDAKFHLCLIKSDGSEKHWNKPS